MNAAQIKNLGEIWGAQHGLLSEAELALLMRVVRYAEVPNPRVLEIGHYFGLSTCAMVHALRARGDEWRLTTLDAHTRDPWVPSTDPGGFQRNRRDHFDDPRLGVVYGPSQSLTDPLEYDAIFYDGDHGEEQRRLTRLVMVSPQVRLFAFDDRDFTVPAECLEELVASGWVDDSPPVNRRPEDKRDPQTMTLAVLRRQEER